MKTKTKQCRLNYSSHPATRTSQPQGGIGKAFLDGLATANPEGFQGRFSRISTRLGLGETLNGTELKLLYDGAFLATLCHIAFNGLGGASGEIRPEKEINRIQLEQKFMAARSRLWASTGWQNLSVPMKETVQRILLSAFVEEEHLRP